MIRSQANFVGGNDDDIRLFIPDFIQGLLIAVNEEINAFPHPNQGGAFVAFRYNQPFFVHHARIRVVDLVAHIANVVIGEQKIMQRFHAVAGSITFDQRGINVFDGLHPEGGVYALRILAPSALALGCRAITVLDKIVMKFESLAQLL